MNQLNQELMAIRNSKAYLKKQLEKETNPHIREKLQHYIDGYSKEEQRVLQELNVRLDDITLTEETEEDQWKYVKYVENQYSTKKDGHTAPMNDTKYAGQENKIKQTHSTTT